MFFLWRLIGRVEGKQTPNPSVQQNHEKARDEEEDPGTAANFVPGYFLHRHGSVVPANAGQEGPFRAAKGEFAWSAWNLHETIAPIRSGAQRASRLPATLSALVRRTNRMHRVRSTCDDGKITAEKSRPMKGTLPVSIWFVRSLR